MFVIFVSLVSFTFVNATRYERFQSFEGKNCELIERNTVSSSVRTNLVNKFGLTGADNCYFVLDSMPYSPDTLYFTFFEDIGYAETYYTVNGSDEYLFILGKDSSALETMTEFVANYTTYQAYLVAQDPDYPYFTMGLGDSLNLPEEFLTDYYDPDYSGPFDQQCVDNADESVYIGNSGSYQDNGTVNFASSCIDGNTLEYNFCAANIFIGPYPISCDCVNGKCMANSENVFHHLRYEGNYLGTAGKKIGASEIRAVVSSWINN